MPNFPSELRYDKVSNRWVVIAAGRANRPHDDWQESPPASKREDPFDPKRIHPDEITDQIRNTDGTEYEEPSTWKALSVWNTYPIVTPDHGKPDLDGSKISGYGFHEIVIHSPDLDKNFEDFSAEQTRAVLELYLKRYSRLSHQPLIKHVQIFTNRGADAGASIPHPHSQIVALPIVPPYIEELMEAGRLHAQKDGDVCDDEVETEIHEATRIVHEDSNFLVYCPYAPHADYHIRIMPKHPGAHFNEITEVQMEHLSEIINLTFKRLDRIAGVPPYNAFIRSAPVDVKEDELCGFRWHIDIVPHLSTPGGLEISTGMDVVTVFPEDAAHALRQDS